MSKNLSDIWQDLPQEERDFISQMAPFCEKGNDFAIEALSKFYQESCERQPARLYYGASIDDTLACLLLGRYHLHGRLLFHRDHRAAELLLTKACQSKNQDIARTADEERMVLSAPIKNTFELSHTTLNKYTGSEKDVVVPPAVRTIGQQAFRKNLSLETVILPSCLEVIEEGAFQGCKNLRSIHIPPSVWRIEARAFDGCEHLEKVLLPTGLIHLGDNAFAACKALKTIALPGTISKVENWTFYKSGLTKAFLHAGIRTIGSYAFFGTPLKEIRLPESLDLIEAHAFSSCEDLDYIIWNGARHLVGQYELKRDNTPFKNAAVFVFDPNHNLRYSPDHSRQPIFTSPHLPPRDINKETYHTKTLNPDGPGDHYLTWIT